MNPDKITVGTTVALADGAVGVVVAIVSEDDCPGSPATGPVRVRLQDQGQTVHVAYEEITEAHAPDS